MPLLPRRCARHHQETGMTTTSTSAHKLPFYRSLYFQVVTAIVIGIFFQN